MRTLPVHRTRIAQVGRAIGMIWLTSITFIFAILDLYFATLPAVAMILVGTAILAITGILLVRSITTLLHAKKIPPDKSADGIQRKRFVIKWFIIVLIFEIAGLNIAPVVLLKLNFIEYIVPVEILIVALHFLPLGRIFAMPVYYILGIVVSAADIATMLFVPASTKIGSLIAIIAIPSLIFIFLNWMIIVYILKNGTIHTRSTPAV
jgi:hypothetical protein